MKFYFTASQTERSQAALKHLTTQYGQHTISDADVIVVLGGDGHMLDCLHKYTNTGIPMFGLSRGTIGFLMNAYATENLPERIHKAKTTNLYPLLMDARDRNGQVFESLAFNEVSLLRQTQQSAHIRIRVNDHVKIERLMGDGVLLATPAGSTAYNLSAHGPVIPLGSHILALTPISPFRPRRWRGAIIPDDAVVEFEVLDQDKRPVSATADNEEVREVISVRIRADKEVKVPVLFDPLHNLEDRILNEQFT
ncbi:NAD kinase [Marinicella sp. W31]|uniref:NAD kinase n=1 Tax=Marinicella sp. W31 TaxID=3023713 RepID=UPI00375641B9